ncbi:MAG: ABC transporter permease [Bacteroidetes bacterium 4572_77]|nr:MAG: ABC transporter permease [Bacteroidetes bacterium 4572_77]
MKGMINIATLELRQSLRSVGFWAYSFLFGGFVAIMFAFGITESQIIGFVGLGRLMVTFMQVSMVILPIYILISTVRAVVGDRETNVMEYMLSLPISFSGYYWGKFWSKLIEIFIPVFLALLGAALWGLFSNISVPWGLFVYYSLLLVAMVVCFLGIAMYVSAMAHSQNVAISTVFILWLILVAFLDLILMGVMLKTRMDPQFVIFIGMINPLQVFRTATLALFDPKLTVMGPASFYILDTVSRTVFIVFAILYPIVMGFGFAALGNRYFKRNDIV